MEQATAPSVSRDLETKVRAGTKWSMLNSIVLSVVGILINAVLARTVFGPAASSLLVSRLAGAGVAGLVAAIAAGAGVYLLIVYPMRSLLQRSPDRRKPAGAAEPANSGTTTSTSAIFDLKESTY
jgi:hypothetical protein